MFSWASKPPKEMKRIFIYKELVVLESVGFKAIYFKLCAQKYLEIKENPNMDVVNLKAPIKCLSDTLMGPGNIINACNQGVSPNSKKFSKFPRGGSSRPRVRNLEMVAFW
jgi:hypothetical protein